MNKLQLYIYMSRRGFKSVRCINPAENVQSLIPQMRQALEKLDYNAAEKYLFYAIRYTDAGTFVTVLRTIPPESADHLASYIYIPNGLKITAAELTEVVQRVTRVVSSPSVTTEQLNDLQQLFSRQYEYDANAPAIAGSAGRDYAVVSYGGNTGRSLADFLGEYIFQPQFLPWTAILLVDSDLQVSTTATVLTDVKVQPSVTLLPPDLSTTKFTPHIYHLPFDRPFRTQLGATVKVRWHRGGFEDLIQSFKVERDGLTLPTPATDDTRKAITPASFFITSQTTKQQIVGAKIRVNGIDIVEAHTFTQQELKNALVEILAPGYAPLRTHLDLASTTQALVQMSEQRKVFRFEIMLRNSSMGAPITFDIPSKNDITESPIEGYEVAEPIREGINRINRLQYTPPVTITRKWLIIIASAALVIGLGLGMLIGRAGHSSPVTDSVQTAVQNAQANPGGQNPQQPQQPAQQPQQPEKPAQPEQQPAQQQPEKPETLPAQPTAQSNAPASAEAIRYLEDNKVWTKAKLDAFPELRGLFEDMNTYNFSKIIDVWGPKLTKSTRFQQVVGSALNCQTRKKFVPKPGETYCTKPGDTAITVYGYRCRIDP